jgi:hypothetical protein
MYCPSRDLYTTRIMAFVIWNIAKIIEGVSFVCLGPGSATPDRTGLNWLRHHIGLGPASKHQVTTDNGAMKPVAKAERRVTEGQKRSNRGRAPFGPRGMRQTPVGGRASLVRHIEREHSRAPGRTSMGRSCKLS